MCCAFKHTKNIVLIVTTYVFLVCHYVIQTNILLHGLSKQNKAKQNKTPLIQYMYIYILKLTSSFCIILKIPQILPVVTRICVSLGLDLNALTDKGELLVHRTGF